MSLVVISDPVAHAALEVGHSWIASTERAAGSSLLRDIRSFSGESRYPWIKLLHFALAASSRPAVEEMISAIRASDPAEVVKHLVGYYDRELLGALPPESVALALKGDSVARASIVAASTLPYPTSLLERLPNEIVGDLVRLLEEWAARVWRTNDGMMMGILVKDAQAKRRAAAAMSAGDLVTHATRGVRWPTYPAGVETVVMIPTHVGRPWVVHTEACGTMVIIYPVSDASVGPASEVATRRLARLAMAVRATHRAAIVGELRESRQTLTQLAISLGVKPTAIVEDLLNLRTAGLITIDADTHRYALRATDLDDLGQLMDAYLGAHAAEPDANSTHAASATGLPHTKFA